jgi:hypothetical protein
MRLPNSIDAIGCFAAHDYIVQGLKYRFYAQSNQGLIIC